MMHTASPRATAIEMPRRTSTAPNALWTSTSRTMSALFPALVDAAMALTWLPLPESSRARR
jgi:hypothetical protein